MCFRKQLIPQHMTATSHGAGNNQAPQLLRGKLWLAQDAIQVQAEIRGVVWKQSLEVVRGHIRDEEMDKVGSS